MSRHGKRREARGRGRPAWPALAIGAAVVVAAALAGFLWLRPAPDDATAGTPRLVLDRTAVDLGYQRFDTLARVVFTLANTGDGPLRVTEVPRVRVVAGC